MSWHPLKFDAEACLPHMSLEDWLLFRPWVKWFSIIASTLAVLAALFAQPYVSAYVFLLPALIIASLITLRMSVTPKVELGPRSRDLPRWKSALAVSAMLFAPTFIHANLAMGAEYYRNYDLLKTEVTPELLEHRSATVSDVVQALRHIKLYLANRIDEIDFDEVRKPLRVRGEIEKSRDRVSSYFALLGDVDLTDYWIREKELPYLEELAALNAEGFLKLRDGGRSAFESFDFNVGRTRSYCDTRQGRDASCDMILRIRMKELHVRAFLVSNLTKLDDSNARMPDTTAIVFGEWADENRTDYNETRWIYTPLDPSHLAFWRNLSGGLGFLSLLAITGLFAVVFRTSRLSENGEGYFLLITALFGANACLAALAFMMSWLLTWELNVGPAYSMLFFLAIFAAFAMQLCILGRVVSGKWAPLFIRLFAISLPIVAWIPCVYLTAQFGLPGFVAALLIAGATGWLILKTDQHIIQLNSRPV